MQFDVQPGPPEEPRELHGESLVPAARPEGAELRVDIPSLELPPPAPCRWPTVAAILDEPSEYCLRYEADLVLLQRTHWRAEMERTVPSLLLVESAWEGNRGEWTRLLESKRARSPDNPLTRLLRYCRHRRIPTVFWNNEDPVHFETFIDAARSFDVVLTTDHACVPRYRERCGHDHVHVMPFAAQPRLHNPRRARHWPRHAVCFAGSWREKDPARRALRHLLDPALSFDLHVFHDNHERQEEDASFPARYRPAVKGSLSYDELLTAYRCYQVQLSAEPVVARRVLESLACGTPVVSTESAGMRVLVGKRVRVTDSREKTAVHLETLLTHEDMRAREAHLGYRHVHERHTYRHRMDELLTRIGMKPSASPSPEVSVVMPVRRPWNVARSLMNFEKQTCRNKELLLILNNASFDLERIRQRARAIPDVHVLHVEGPATLGDCLNRGVQAASGRFIARMDDDDHYGPRYLSDMMLAARFSDAEVTGKGTYFSYVASRDVTSLRSVSPEHADAIFVLGSTFLIKREVLERVPFQPVTRGEDTAFLRDAAAAGCRVYSADRFNFITVRRRDTSDHVWKVPDDRFLKSSRDPMPGLALSRVMF